MIMHTCVTVWGIPIQKCKRSFYLFSCNLFHAPSRIPKIDEEGFIVGSVVPLMAKYSFDILLGRDFQGTKIASCQNMIPLKMTEFDKWNYRPRKINSKRINAKIER